MNDALKLLIILIVFLSCSSCEKCNTNDPTDSRIATCFLKAGSYFVYTDSVDHITDSQYVSKYSYSAHSLVLYTSDGCSTLADVYNMAQVSYRNGLFYDSIYSYTQDPTELWRNETTGDVSPQAPAFVPSVDTLINSFSVSGTVYPAVYRGSPELITEGSDTISTDLYFAPGYGIVKRVEHRPTGDISWDLIRYHIVQ